MGEGGVYPKRLKETYREVSSDLSNKRSESP